MVKICNKKNKVKYFIIFFFSVLKDGWGGERWHSSSIFSTKFGKIGFGLRGSPRRYKALQGGKKLDKIYGYFQIKKKKKINPKRERTILPLSSSSKNLKWNKKLTFGQRRRRSMNRWQHAIFVQRQSIFFLRTHNHNSFFL